MRLLLCLLVLLLGEIALAQADGTPPNDEERVPFETIWGRSIGVVRRAAVFDWRKSPLILSFETGQPVEYNNFNSQSWGLGFRFPGDILSYRLGLVRTVVTDSASSRQLRNSPFIQAGRSSRWEWHNAFELPIHEGIGSQLTSWIAPSQFVVAAVAELNFSIYETNNRYYIKDLINPRLSTTEMRHAERDAPKSMKVSEARHDLGIGLEWDNYFSNGAHWFYRTLFCLAPMASEDELKHWLTISFGAGYAL